jgi:hypothetical protein
MCFEKFKQTINYRYEPNEVAERQRYRTDGDSGGMIMIVVASKLLCDEVMIEQPTQANLGVADILARSPARTAMLAQLNSQLVRLALIPHDAKVELILEEYFESVAPGRAPTLVAQWITAVAAIWMVVTHDAMEMWMNEDMGKVEMPLPLIREQMQIFLRQRDRQVSGNECEAMACDVFP